MRLLDRARPLVRPSALVSNVSLCAQPRSYWSCPRSVNGYSRRPNSDLLRGKARTRGTAQALMRANRRGIAAASHPAAKPLREKSCTQNKLRFVSQGVASFVFSFSLLFRYKPRRSSLRYRHGALWQAPRSDEGESDEGRDDGIDRGDQPVASRRTRQHN